MLQTDRGPLFSLGFVTITPGARKLSGEDIMEALLRHMRCDRGHAKASFSEPTPVLEGCRVLSAYRSKAGQPFWIITEADHSKTTVLLPEELNTRATSRYF